MGAAAGGGRGCCSWEFLATHWRQGCLDEVGLGHTLEAVPCRSPFVSGCSDPDGLAQPAHCMVLEMTSWDQGPELSSATMLPHMTVVANLTSSED